MYKYCIDICLIRVSGRSLRNILWEYRKTHPQLDQDRVTSIGVVGLPQKDWGAQGHQDFVPAYEPGDKRCVETHPGYCLFSSYVDFFRVAIVIGRLQCLAPAFGCHGAFE